MLIFLYFLYNFKIKNKREFIKRRSEFMKNYSLGIDIGGTFIKYALVDDN